MKLVAALVAACVALTLPSSSLVAQSPRALTIEDYYKIKSVGDPQISPDGKWVAFTLTTRVEEDNTNAIETFVVPADGSAAPRRITHEGKSVATPRWTDDNLLQYSLNAKVNSDVFLGGDRARSRAFAATRRCSRSLSIPRMPRRCRRPRRPQERSAPMASGARRRASCRARRLPKSRAPISRSGMHRDSRAAPSTGCDSSPTARIIRRRIRARALRPEIAITAVDGGQPKTITTLGMRAANVAWHPGGSTIAFTADDTWQNEQAYEQPDIYTVTTSGDVKRLTNDGYVWGSLSYSPDGQFLLSERTFGTAMIIEKKLSHGGSDDLIAWPASGGAPINLTASWDLEPNAPRWSPDSKYVYFTAEKGGTTHVFRVAARAGAPVEQVTKGERRLNNITFDKAMTRIAYSVGTYDSPSDMWTANIDGTGEKRLTDLFADIRAEIAHHEDGAHHLEEQRRHRDRRLADAAVRISAGSRRVRIRSSSSTTAARIQRSATASTSSSSTSRPTATSCSTPTSAARPATAMRSSGRRGARGARRTARTSSPASTT